MEQQSLKGFSVRVLIVVGIVGLAVLLALFFWSVANILLLVFAGLLAATFLNTFAEALSGRARVPYGLSLALVVLALVALLFGLGWFLVPRLERDVAQLSEQIPAALEHLRETLRSTSWGAFLLERLPSATQIAAPNRNLASRITGVFSTVLNTGTQILFVLISAVYFSVAPRMYYNGFLRLFPLAWHAQARRIMGEISAALRWWLLGQFIAMVIIGTCVGVGLWVLGRPFALSLGIVAGLFEFIPIAGPILSSIPAILLAFVDSPTTALYVLLFFLVIYQLEGNVIIPIVHQKTVLLPPILTLTALLILGVFFGFLGIMLATPLTAVVIVLVKTLYLEDTLGEHVVLRTDKKGTEGVKEVT